MSEKKYIYPLKKLELYLKNKSQLLGSPNLENIYSNKIYSNQFNEILNSFDTTFASGCTKV